MKKIILSTLVFSFAFVALAFLAPTPAGACTERCVLVSTSPFCLRCIDIGTFTGAGCQNSGTCGCFFIQMDCSVSAPQEDQTAGLEQQLFAEPKATQCTNTPAAEGTAQPAATVG